MNTSQGYYSSNTLAKREPRILTFNSRNRTSIVDSSSDFYFQTRENLDGEYELLYVGIPNTFFNVSSGINNSIPFKENGVNKLATLTEGYYDPTTLATAIASALTTVSAGYNTYAVTWTQTSLKFTIVAGNSFQFLWGTSTSTLVDSTAITLGFSPRTDTATGISISSDKVIDLTYPQSFFIKIDQNIYIRDVVQSSSGGGTFCVPIDSNSGGSFVYWSPNAPTGFNQKATISPTNNPRIQLLDYLGRQISLNGADYVFMLREVRS